MSAVAAAALREARLDADSLKAVTATLAAHAPTHDADASFPWPGIHAVHEAGLLTASVAEHHGGRGLSARETVDVFAALGEGDPSVALISAMTVAQHAFQAASPTWPAGLYEKVLRESAERPTLLNAVRAEPELGAPARGGLPATTARRTADGWSVSGRKGFATGSEGLAYHAVWVVTDEADQRVGHVIVPGDDPGIRIERTWDHLGMRASSTHDVIYDDVRVPFENFSGAPVGTVPNNGAIPGAIALAVPALYLGVAKAALAAFVEFAGARTPTSLGRPIATLERIQTVAGEAHAQITQADLVLGAVAAQIDGGRVVPTPTPGNAGALAGASERVGPAASLGLVKLLTSRGAIAAVQGIVAAIGNPGLTRSLPFERHLRDVLCARPHPPQDDAALLAAGRSILLP
ncbi:MAG TPA: acyl-CoA dehydrogenase family protein [Microbacterium sp.]|uniref:acyl-CoA dehydrogenase family protein n=1 Tax=Microbacterium sp. TaxID=51671 RepID=UPI002C422BB8|nr:acyl-CoA dehydrogenase family protein [Microbacterium sp.]HWI32477.1 acyl-CoA dehydrogenase family protein [Microbacterium sp.]